LELFPELHRDLQSRDYSVYLLFFDLKPMLRAAHDAEDHRLLQRIYGFAEWCSRQTAKDLWNAAGVAFYEHLFDYPEYAERVIPWLSPGVVYQHWDLWEGMVSPEEWARVRALLEGKREEFIRHQQQRIKRSIERVSRKLVSWHEDFTG
jgi:hypothetical protein